jgi:hypothetical protein
VFERRTIHIYDLAAEDPIVPPSQKLETFSRESKQFIERLTSGCENVGIRY